MESVGVFVSRSALTWSLAELRKLPKDQLALIFALILSKVPTVEYPREGHKSPFEIEMGKYLEAPISSTRDGVFNPIDGQWRAENYFQSTVFGRLLNGSHSWTSPELGYFERTPKSGWPARIEFTQRGFEKLFLRTSPPCLKREHLLPILAVAVYYLRQVDLKPFGISSTESLVRHYSELVLGQNPHVGKLFEKELPVFWGELLADHPMSRQELVECFRQSQPDSKEKIVVSGSMLAKVRSVLQPGDSIESFIQRAIQKELGKDDNS